MKIEDLRKRVADQVTEVKLPDDQTVLLRKLTVEDGLALGEWADAHKKPEGVKDTPADMVAYYVFLLSKCIVDRANKLTLDSDEGRELLAKLCHGDLFRLGKRANQWSGLAADDAKKNSPLTNSSPTSSAETSDTAAQTN